MVNNDYSGPARDYSGEVCLPSPILDVHRAYLSGLLPEDLMGKIDAHILKCKRCENTWDALTSSLEDGLPTEIRDAEDGLDGRLKD